MHERRLELSMARRSGPGQTPSVCHQALTSFISPRLLFAYIKAAGLTQVRPAMLLEECIFA